MSSTAFSAQGSVVSIGTAVGAANPLTSISATSPAIVSDAGHGFSNGDIVTLSGIVGTMSVFNGQSFVVSSATASAYALTGTDATGLTYTSGGSATPVSWTPIANVKSYSGFDGMASEIDVTNLSSQAKEIRLGLQDFGKFSMDVNPDYSDAGQNAVRAAQASGAQKNFKLAYPNGKVASFAAFVKGSPVSGGVDAVVAGTIELRVNGLVTIA
ncbi:MAG: phage tail tube protein [Janthinobacterium lividum]